MGKSKMDRKYSYLVFLAVLISFLGSLSASCSNPPTPSGVTEEIHLHPADGGDRAPRSTYDHGSRAVYACNADGGYGVVTLLCQADDTWAARDRECGDAVKFNKGSLVGIVGTSITLFLMIFVVFFTKSSVKLDVELDSLADQTDVAVESESIVVISA